MHSAGLRLALPNAHSVIFLMNIRKLLLVSAAILGLTGHAFAQAQATEATVAKVTGTASAQLPDGSTITLEAGKKLPQGATITTGDKSDVYLVSHNDTTSVITANSVVSIAELSTTSVGGKVTKQTAALDLKSGNLVAKLNPNKKDVNNYSVRTPKGVAAARGTVFTVTYKGNNYSISVVNGQVGVSGAFSGFVNFTMDAGQTAVSIPGFGSGDITPIAQNLNAFSGLSEAHAAAVAEVKEVMAIAAATVAVAAANNIGGTTSAEAAAIVRTIIQAVPDAAPAIAALVAASAPTMSQTVVEITRDVAPEQSAVVEQVVRDTPPPPTTPPPPADTPPPPTPQPQPIDPTTVSRSGE
jgi:hypothetical protein